MPIEHTLNNDSSKKVSEIDDITLSSEDGA